MTKQEERTPPKIRERTDAVNEKIDEYLAHFAAVAADENKPNDIRLHAAKAIEVVMVLRSGLKMLRDSAMAWAREYRLMQHMVAAAIHTAGDAGLLITADSFEATEDPDSYRPVPTEVEGGLRYHLQKLDDTDANETEDDSATPVS